MARRTAISAAVSAGLLALNVVTLTLFLNPELSLFAEWPALVSGLFLPYFAGAFALSLGAALVAATFRFWPEVTRPPIESLPWFGSLTLVTTSLAAALYWLNLLSYRWSIPPASVRALAAAAALLAVLAVVQLLIGVDAVLYPLRGRALSAALSIVAAGASGFGPLALVPAPPAASPVPATAALEAVRPQRRIVLVGIDGLGPEPLRQAIAAGDAPALERLMRRGAWGPLGTIEPTEGPPLWATLATGTLPHVHGVKSFASYRLPGSPTPVDLLPKGAFVTLLERFGFVSRVAIGPASRRRPAIWNALDAFGQGAGLVRVWGTHPPEKLRGFVLSPYFHLLREDPARAASTLYPPDLWPEASARTVEARDVDPALLAEFVDLTGSGAEDGLPWRRELVERALAPDLSYSRAGAMLRQAYDPSFYALLFHGLDATGHVFLRFSRPDAFGDVSPEQARRYGHVLPRYLGWVSQQVGELAQSLAPDDVLVVVSTYGMEPVPFWRRLASLALGLPDQAGSHAGAPDGLVLFAGGGIRAGALVDGASILDLAPTLLYLMGLPVARDMEGRVLVEVVDPARAQPVTWIPSYRSIAVTPVTEDVGFDDLPPLPEEP
ncbi:MAG: alkaline phosphatase family protein [Vicinamibacteria bacterium]|nr:alkaline phosphatase family protein [Vicinamibacteria bacterium]